MYPRARRSLKAQRRKTLANGLSNAGELKLTRERVTEVLESMGLSATIRGEALTLDIFVDRSVVEVFANKRQAICRRVYPDHPADAVGVKLIGKTAVTGAEAWEMMPSNPY